MSTQTPRPMPSELANALRARVIAAGRARTQTVLVDLGGPDPELVEIRELSGTQRAAVLDASMKTDEDGNPTGVIDQGALVPAVLIACLQDPHTHAPIFTEADRDAIGQLSATFLDALFKPAARLSNLLEEDLEKLKGNSSAAASAASSSPSPANSE